MANITDEKQYGLASKLIIKCQFCSKDNTVETSSTHKCGKAGSAAYDINSRASLASLHAGIGETHLTSIMSIMNIPPMARASFKTRERETGKAVENVARASCSQIITDEKDKLIGTGEQLDENNLMAVSCSYDMGWQKRGKGFNSNTDQAAVMSQSSGKIFDYATKGKKCRTCEYAERSNTNPKVHDCRKNHTGSSKSMEPLSAVELFKNAPNHGIKYSSYTGDEDSTTELYLNQQVPYGIEKFSDIIHIKRSITTRLYNLSKTAQFKDSSTLSAKVINYLVKCFSIVVAQNKSDPAAMKSSLRCIVPHCFGDHSGCCNSWCKYQQNPSEYKHKNLPYGKDLYGDSLKSALTEIFSQYYNDIVEKKLSPAANSQRNESFNSVVGSKAPKIRYYGGSESNDFWVACAVAQTNVGYGYVCRTLEALGIDPGLNCSKYSSEMDKKKENASKRKQSIEFKQRRNEIHNQRIKTTARKEKQEGPTYQSNVGLNLDQSALPVTTESVDVINHIIKENIPEETVAAYEKSVSAYVRRPNCTSIEFSCDVDYNIILFDVETNTTGKTAQLCQLSAIDKTGQNCYSQYILPDKDIDKYATRVNKLTVKTVNGNRTLFKDDVALQTLTSQEAISRFVSYIQHCIDCCKARTRSDVCTVLIGHNAKRFDIPILLRNSSSEIHARMQALGISFGDSLSMFEHFLKIKHPAFTQSSGKTCSSNQSSIYEALFNEKFAAHDAKEDVIALRKILFSSPMNLTEEDIITLCKPISSSDALKDCQFLDQRYQLLQTMKYKLYSEAASDQAPITKSMAEKIAGSGLSYHDLKELFVKHGKKALITVLSKPPTASQTNKPRVTQTPRILASILKHFEHTL